MHAAREGEHHADRGVGHFFGAVVGHVGNRNAAAAHRHDPRCRNPRRNGRSACNAPAADRCSRDAEVVEQHQRVGIFDKSGQFRLIVPVQGCNVGQFAQHAALGIQRPGDEIGQDYLKTSHE